MLEIEINAMDAGLQSRSFPAKEGKPARTVYWQFGYMYNGGLYPVRCELPLKEGQPPYPAGKYFIHPTSFQVSKFNKIELNPFEITLIAREEKKVA